MIDVAVMGGAALGSSDNSQQRHAICLPVESLHVAPSKLRGRGKQFVDPCEVAPLKKRRIQVRNWPTFCLCMYIEVVLLL